MRNDDNDYIPCLVEWPTESVVPREVAEAHRGELEKINAGGSKQEPDPYDLIWGDA